MLDVFDISGEQPMKCHILCTQIDVIFHPVYLFSDSNSSIYPHNTTSPLYTLKVLATNLAI